MHIGAKLTLRYSMMYVADYYEFNEKKNIFFFSLIGFGLKDFNIFRHKVLILLITKLHTYRIIKKNLYHHIVIQWFLTFAFLCLARTPLLFLLNKNNFGGWATK